MAAFKYSPMKPKSASKVMPRKKQLARARTIKKASKLK